MLNSLGSLLASILFAAVTLVPAKVETEAAPYPKDALDDIAIWIHPEHAELSLVIAAVKVSQGSKPAGIAVYNLLGKRIQFLAGASPNNIDLRYNFNFRGKRTSIIAVSHWWSNTVRLYTIDKATRILSEITTKPIATGLKKLRGLCMYYNPDLDEYYYFTSSKQGGIEQYQIISADDGVTARKIRQLALPSIVEGCVVDDELAKFYVAQENVAIWKFDAMPGGSDKGSRVAAARRFGNRLKKDIEGLTIYYGRQHEGYLIASSQGNDRFIVYDRQGDNRYLGSFRIGSNRDQAIDAVTHTDGIDVTNFPLGKQFPHGMFIAQDDQNTDRNESPIYQNFKFVDWKLIADALDLSIDTERDPHGQKPALVIVPESPDDD